MSPYNFVIHASPHTKRINNLSSQLHSLLVIWHCVTICQRHVAVPHRNPNLFDAEKMVMENACTLTKISMCWKMFGGNTSLTGCVWKKVSIEEIRGVQAERL